jgi:hypothetical protein
MAKTFSARRNACTFVQRGTQILAIRWRQMWRRKVEADELKAQRR